jgi:hypothetical protein
MVSISFDIDNSRYRRHIDGRRFRTGDDTPRRRSSEMSEAYLTNWLVDRCQSGSRSHFHDVALREARIATQRHELQLKSPVRESLVARLRLAFAGPSTNACNCPA